MVAIVTGNGLGLERSSAKTVGTLGQLGGANPVGLDGNLARNAGVALQIGSAFLGRGGDSVSVNAANGNLIIQNTDELVYGRGLDTAFNRTYNSQGTFTNLAGGADTDNWLGSNDRKITLGGTGGAAGSTATLTDWDGTVVVFTWDAASSSYKSTEPGYRDDTLTWATNTFTYREGSSRRVETYAANLGGRLVSAADADGNLITYTYDAASTAGKLTRITTANSTATQFNYTSLTYTGTNLTTLVTSSYDTVSATNKTLTRTRYGYDAANRLITVTVDLTPGDNAITDGARYVTTYAYKDATSKLVTSITQTDGTALTIAYDASNRVAQLVQTASSGVTRTTQLVYDTASRVTTITDPAAQVTKMSFDTSNRLTKIESATPTGGNPTITTYEYTAAGDVSRVLVFDSAANVGNAALAIASEVSRYDALGNLLERVDGGRSSVAFTYGSLNEVLSETRYTAVDANGLADGVAPGVAMVVRYVYDDAANSFNDDGSSYTGTNGADVAEKHLRFRISAEGRVTEYRYDASGQLTATIDYAGTAYTGTTWTEAALATWVGTATTDKANVQRSDTTYDFRGNISTVTSYSAADVTGAGLTTQDYTRTTFVYDQFGKLLSRLVSGTNALGGEAVAVAETFAYDGLGRVIRSTDTYGQATSISINDGTRVTTIATPGDITRTMTYNIAGELLSDAVGATGVTTGTTTYAYDNLGRLRMATDALGARTYYVYDKRNRLTGQIDHDGSITETRYDAADRVVATVRYATLATAAVLTSLQTVTTNVEIAAVRPTANAKDQWSWSVYDKSGRLVETIDATGAVSTLSYDAASRLTATRRYANLLAATTINGTDGISGYRTTAPSAPVLPGADATNDRVARSFYDNDGLLVATLDEDGFLSEILYDKAGRKIETVRYLNAAGASFWASGTLAQLKGSIAPVAARDIRNYWIYDGRGRVAATIDGEGNVTRYHYTARGDIDQESRGQQVTASTSYTLATLPTATTTLEVTRYYRNAAGQITSRVRTLASGTETVSYLYDTRGRLVSQSTAESVSTEARSQRFRYDNKGRLIGEIGGIGAAALDAYGASPTEAQKDLAFATYGTRYVYDVADRLIQKLEADGTGSGNSRSTLYYYDTDGQLRFEINGLGEVSEYRYNALEYRSDAIVYGARLTPATLATLTGGLVNPAVTNAVAAIAISTADSRTSYGYTNRGELNQVFDPQYVASAVSSNMRTIAYNAFGEVSSQSRAADTTGAKLDTQNFTYNRRGLRATAQRLLAGVSTGSIQQKYDYDGFGRMVSQRDNATDLRTHTWDYDRAGRLVKTTDNLGVAASFIYDARSNLISQTDRTGKVTKFEFDAFGRNVKTTTPEGVVSTVQRNAYGQTIKITDGAGRTKTYTYDKNGNLKTVTDAAGTTTNSYDNADRLTDVVDAKNIATRYTYDLAGRVLTRVEDYGTGKLNLTTAYSYDAKGQRLQIIEAQGSSVQRTTTFSYDLNGQKLSVIEDDGGLAIRTAYTYNGDGTVATQTDAVGTTAERRTKFDYDTMGRLVAKTEDQGTGKLNIVTRYEYDVNNNMVASTDALGRVTRFVYDKENRLQFSVNAEGEVTETGYDGEGRVIWTRRFTNRIAATTLASLANALTAANVTGNAATATTDQITRTIYDGDGRVAYVIDGEGFVTRNSYDGANNVVKTWRYAAAVSAMNGTTKANLDALVPAGDPTDAAITTSVYDGANRLTDITDATGVVTHFVLDALGQITETHVAYGTTDVAVTRRLFDNLGRVTSETRAFGQPEAATTSYGYDALGRVTSLTDPRGFSTTRTYDKLGRLLSESVPVDASIFATTSYQYDARGNRVKITDPRLNVGYFYYDALDRLTVQLDPEGYITKTTYAIGTTVASVTRYANRAANLGDVSTTTQPTVDASTVLDATTRFAYDKLDRVKTATDAADGLESYTYDAFGNRTSMTNKLGGVTNYAYDRRGRMVSETVVMDAHDYLGNRVVSEVQTTYEYDARGNLKSKVEGANVPAGNNMSYAKLTTTYEYDKLDRLTKLTDPTFLSMTPVTTYQYDKRGNQVLQTAADGSKVYSYFDRANNKVAEVQQTGTLTTWTYDGNGNAISRKVWATPLGLPAAIGGTPPTAIANDTVRETQFVYDRNNRLVQTAIVNVRTGQYNGTSYVTTAAQNLNSYNQYDAAGNLLKETDARGSAIFHYYDKNGRETAKVDQEGYVTTWTRDSNGNVTSETRFATRFTGTPVAGGTAPTVAASGDDRTTTFTYDRMGRRLTETRLGVVASVTNSTGAIVAAGTSATITYSYNLMGQVTSKREATQDKTDYQYDKQGRLERQLDAVATDFNATSLRHVSYFYYDANNNLVRTVERAEVGTASAGLPGTGAALAAGYTDADSRVSVFGYNGRVLQNAMDAQGNQRHYWYDIMGRRTYDYYTRLNSAGANATGDGIYEGNLTSYDAAGRVAAQWQAKYNTAGAWVAQGPVTQFGYNAYGDVATRQVDGKVKETFSYDNAGRVVKTTGGDGVYKFFVYDANGNATLLLQSNGRNLAGETVDSLLTSLGSIHTMTAADVVGTISVFDKRNQGTSTREPNRTIANVANLAQTVSQALVRSRTYNAFGEATSETDARGNVTNFAYNTVGKLTQKQSPTVNVTAENGVTTAQRPTENYGYDISGRLVGVQDANGYWTTRALQAGTGYGSSEAKVLKEFRPDGSVAETRYDAFGDARTVIDELGRVTTQGFDKLGRIVQQIRPSGTTEYFAYDILGQRIKHWNTAWADPIFGEAPLITDRQPIFGDAPIINNVVYGPRPFLRNDRDGNPIYGPAPIIGYGDPIYGTAPVIDPGGAPIYGPAPLITDRQPIYGDAPIINNPVYGPGRWVYPRGEPVYIQGPIIGYGDPVYGPAPVIDPGGAPIYGTAPLVTPAQPIYGPAPIINNPVYGPGQWVNAGPYGSFYVPGPIIGYGDPIYGPAPLITDRQPIYGQAPVITPGQPIYGPAPIINNPVYGPAPFRRYDRDGNEIYGPAPIIGYGDPIYGPAPLITDRQPIYGPAPLISGGQPIYGEAPLITPSQPIYGEGRFRYIRGEELYIPGPIIGYTDPVYGQPPIIGYTDAVYGEAPIIGYTDPVYGQAPIIGYTGPVYGERPIIGYTDPVYGERPIVGYTDPVYGQAPIIGYTGPVYGERPIVGYTDPVYGQAPIVGYTPVVYGERPITGYTGPVYGERPIIGYTDPVYGTRPIIGYTPVVYGERPITGYTGPVYGERPIIGYTDPVYGAKPVIGYNYKVETTDYDIAGRVISTRNFAGDVTTYSYSFNALTQNTGLGLSGAWTKTTTQANGKTAKETTDLFGRMLTRTDLGGHVINYSYNLAGQLTSQTSTAGQKLAYTYYNTGKMATMADNAGVPTGYTNANIDSTYTYDADGNRTFERMQGTTYYYDYEFGTSYAGTVTLQEGRGTWDGLNRLVTFNDTGSSGNGVVSLTNQYDAAGNVRRTVTTHATINANQTLGASVTEDYWYKYDAMNRMTLVKGSLVNGAIIRNNEIARSITYDAAGQRASESRTVYYETAQGRLQEVFRGHLYEAREIYTTNADGLVTQVSLAQGAETTWLLAAGTLPPSPAAVASASGPGTVRAQTAYDAMGRITDYKEFDTAGTAVYSRYGITYDARGNVLSESTKLRRVESDGGLYDTYATTTNTYDTLALLTASSTANFRWKINSNNTSSYQDTPDTRTEYTYDWWDSAQQKMVKFTPDTAKPGTSHTTSLYYDVNGHLSSAYINDGRPRSVSYVNDANGQVMVRTEQDRLAGGDPKQVWWYFDGRQVGTTGNNGNADPDYTTALAERVAMPTSATNGAFRLGSTTGAGHSDFDQAYNSLSPGEASGPGSSYVVRSGDSLGSVAQALYGDASLWYLIADANGLKGSEALAAGRTLTIPARLANVHNTSSTFRPYDTAQHIGDLQPTTPTPPAGNKGCGAFGAILLAVIAIAVVTVLTAGTGAPLAGSSVASALGLGTGATATAVGTVIGGTLAAAAGSIVSQGFGVLTGLQDKFSWKGVALAALGGAVGGALKGFDVFSKLGLGGNVAGSQFLGDVARGMVSSVAYQGAAVATGLQNKFDWVGVAAAGVGAGVGGAVARELPALKLGKVGNLAVSRIATSGASLLANAATRSVLEGSDFGDNIVAGLPDVIAQTVGGIIESSLQAKNAKGADAGKDDALEVSRRDTTYGDFDSGQQAQIAQGARLIADYKKLEIGELLDDPTTRDLLIWSVDGDRSTTSHETRLAARKTILRQAGVPQSVIDKAARGLPSPPKFLGLSPAEASSDSIIVSEPVYYALDVLDSLGGYVAKNLNNPYLSTGLFLYGAVTAPISTTIMTIIDYTPAGTALRRAEDAVVQEVFKGVNRLANAYGIDAGRVGRVALGGLTVVAGAALGYKAVPLLRKGASLIKGWVGKGAERAAPKITWVDENVGLRGLAKEYNDSAQGARSNVLTQSGQAPAITRTMSDGTTRLVKFDGVDGMILVDRKLSIVTTAKAQAQALRQSEALSQNGLTARWEVPTTAQQTRAVNMLKKLNISNISVEVVKPW